MFLHILFALLLAVVVAPVQAESPAVAGARRSVDLLNNTLIEVMKNADR